MWIFASSSMANTTPPNGVLNAAASPAAAPVKMKLCFESFGQDLGVHLFTIRKMEPAI